MDFGVFLGDVNVRVCYFEHMYGLAWVCNISQTLKVKNLVPHTYLTKLSLA